MIMLLDFGLHAPRRLVLSGLFASGNDDDQIASLSGCRFHSFCSGIWEILFHPFKVFEQLRITLRRK